MPEPNQSPDQREWEIDRLLQRSIGAQIRVRVEAFAPFDESRPVSLRLIEAERLLLPDNAAVAGHPLFFEGRLDKFMREIGVVHVHLGPPDYNGAQGMVFFRQRMAVILQGPAIARLAFPFQVERLPLMEENYWQDLRLPGAQFLLPFLDDIVKR